MSDQVNASDVSLEAGEDLTSYQYYIMGILATDGKAYLADGTETIVLGVLQNKPDITQVASVRHACGKRSKVIYGGTVTVGAYLKTSSGKAVVTTTAGDRVIGLAMSAGSINEIGDVLFEPGSYPAT